jgi:hypothetical protein
MPVHQSVIRQMLFPAAFVTWLKTVVSALMYREVAGITVVLAKELFLLTTLDILSPARGATAQVALDRIAYSLSTSWSVNFLEWFPDSP